MVAAVGSLRLAFLVTLALASGTLTCHARSSRKRTSKPFVKIASAPPKLLEARRGGEFVLECSARGRPAPEVTWLKNGIPLHDQFTTSDFGPSFSGKRNVGFPRESMAETKARAAVECADEGDAALYECIAENAAERVSVATEVSVVGDEASGMCMGRELAGSLAAPPQITQWMGTYMQVMGTDARLICRAQGPGRLEVIWMGPNDEVVEYESGKYVAVGDGDLVVRGLQWSDMGMHKCVARNEFGEDMKEAFLYPLAATPTSKGR